MANPVTWRGQNNARAVNVSSGSGMPMAIYMAIRTTRSCSAGRLRQGASLRRAMTAAIAMTLKK
jgi:hypothetical protein